MPDSAIRYLLIGLGSALGGMARYWCGGAMARALGETFPWGTFVVNVAGCAFIGWFAGATAPEGRLLVPPLARQFVMVGVCGGFTTFSSFGIETLRLAGDGQYAKAAANIAGSLVLCLAGVWLGYEVGSNWSER
jgi:CrcB protein